MLNSFVEILIWKFSDFVDGSKRSDEKQLGLFIENFEIVLFYVN